MVLLKHAQNAEYVIHGGPAVPDPLAADEIAGGAAHAAENEIGIRVVFAMGNDDIIGFVVADQDGVQKLVWKLAEQFSHPGAVFHIIADVQKNSPFHQKTSNGAGSAALCRIGRGNWIKARSSLLQCG